MSLEAGEIDEAFTYLDNAFAIGEESGVPILAYNMECIRVWRTALAGDLGEAERLALSAAQLGVEQGIEHAVVGPGLQIASIRWQQGRFAELLPLMRREPAGDEPGAVILLARALACTDATRAEAAARLHEAARHDLDDVPLGLHWAGCMVAAAEVAWMLGDARVGRVVHARLLPLADRVAFNGSFTIAPIAYGAALAAAAAGERGADDLFERAIAMSRRLRAPVLRARAELAWGRVLTARGGAPAKVLSLVGAARATFVEHGLGVSAGTADDVLREVELALQR